MGKLVAYLGPAIPVSTVVEGGSSSLVRQASDCPDGFGLGWYPDDALPEPVRLVSSDPITRAEPHMSVPRRYQSSCAIAALRRADGSRAALSGLMPFTSGRLLFAMIGGLQRFDDVFRRPLTQRLSDQAFSSLPGLSAPEILFATFLEALGDERGHDAIASALEQLVGVVSEVGIAADAAATLGVVVADGEGIVTLRTSTQGPPPPLYTIVADRGAPLPATGRVVASEPLFPGAWSALDPHSLVIFTTSQTDD